MKILIAIGLMLVWDASVDTNVTYVVAYGPAPDQRTNSLHTATNSISIDDLDGRFFSVEIIKTP